MNWEQGCLFCGWSGIDEENSYPAEGPSYYSMGEPPHIEPCICQYGSRLFYAEPLPNWNLEPGTTEEGITR